MSIPLYCVRQLTTTQAPPLPRVGQPSETDANIAPSNLNSSRIEDCIQRYQSRRRLAPDRALFFSKYLCLGGIDTTQRQFTGTAQLVKDFKEDEYTKEEIREITANACINRDGDPKGRFFSPSAPEHWDVDFAGVVAGFL